MGSSSSVDGAVIVMFFAIVFFGGLILGFAALMMANFQFDRVSRACSTFFRVLRGGSAPETIEKPKAPPIESPKPLPAKPSGAPLRLLAILQRDGRLLDFLLEDIQQYPDLQIGAAVRDIHKQCQAALREHLVLEPVLAEQEGNAVEVPAGFNPSEVRLTGNVTGVPPFRGTLRHHGWRVKELKLAPVAEGQNEFVLMPAEVELA